MPHSRTTRNLYHSHSKFPAEQRSRRPTHRGCRDSANFFPVASSQPRLNLFGITGAATQTDEGWLVALPHRLNLFGITGAATASIASHCSTVIRLNLFGITGAATTSSKCLRNCLLPASISLESRVLRPRDDIQARLFLEPPQSLWNHGCCDSLLSLKGRRRLPPQSLWNHGCCDSTTLVASSCTGTRLNLFGITGAATREGGRLIWFRGPPQSLWNHGCCDSAGILPA